MSIPCFQINVACTNNSKLIDPLGLSTVTACIGIIVRQYVRPHFSKSSKTKQSENNVRYTGETLCLAEWIIDDTCLVVIYFIVTITTITVLCSRLNILYYILYLQRLIDYSFEFYKKILFRRLAILNKNIYSNFINNWKS